MAHGEGHKERRGNKSITGRDGEGREGGREGRNRGGKREAEGGKAASCRRLEVRRGLRSFEQNSTFNIPRRRDLGPVNTPCFQR